MGEVSDKAIARKLNAVWEEQREVKTLLGELIDLQKSGDTGRISEELRRLGETYAILVDKTGNAEPINIDRLVDEVKRFTEDVRKGMDSREFPEVQKIVGDVNVAELKDFKQMILDALTKDGVVSISNLPETFDIQGKTLTKIDGNSPKNPLFVQLTDGKTTIDLEKLFRVSVSVPAMGGGVSDSASGGGATPNYKVFKQTVGSYQYVGMATPGTASDAPQWRCFRVDKSITNIVTVDWADGNDSFDNILDDITTLDYS